MANHKSAKKRIRSNHTKYLHNRYYLKSCRTFIKKLKAQSDKTAALELLPQACSMLDKLVLKRIIHRNKSARAKSSLTKHVNGLAA